MVLVALRTIDDRDPLLLGVIATGVGHEHVLGPLNPEHIIIDQDLDRVSPELPIDVDAKVVEANVAMSAHATGDVAEAEDPPETGRLDTAPPGVAQDDLRRHIVNPALGIGALMGSMAPELIIVHELPMLAIHRLALGASREIGIQHPALDGKSPLGEVLPGMALGNGGPLNAELG
jgi:hypothetical protein